MQTWVIVVAAGSGARFGGMKQFEDLAGTRLVDRAVATASRAADGVVLVLPPGTEWDGPAVAGLAPGGATRAASVRSGLELVPATAEVIAVHDAARPLATDALYTAVVDAVRAGADGAVPALAVADTIKRVAGERIVETVARDDLVAVQTPQAFRADVLRRAHAGGADGTDDAALVEAIGATVVTVPGEPANVKVTASEDLAVLESLLRAGERR